MRKLALMLFMFAVLASSVLAADVSFTYIDSSCDGEGRGIFYFSITYEEPFLSEEALIKGFPGDWYDCAEAHCSYDFYQEPPGVSPKRTINSGREHMLITEPLTFLDNRIYDLEFIYPIVVNNKLGEDYNTIKFSLDCPGYDFSCSLYSFKLDKCYSDGKKFRMEMTAEGIDQPNKVDLIDDFRYRLVGEKTQIEEDRPLTDASVKSLKGTALAEPSKANVTKLANDRYAIEFPYEDTAKWLTVNGHYCRNDKDRFGMSSNFEFLEIKKCENTAPATVTTTSSTTGKYYPATPQKTVNVSNEQPEKKADAQEIGFFSFFKLIFQNMFGKKN